MKRAIAALLASLAIAGTAHADDWTTGDTVLLGATMGVTVLDWAQTRQIARNPVRIEEDARTITTHNYRELNPLVGQNPSLARVNTYFALALTAEAGVAIALPHYWRQGFLVGVLALETAVVIRNRQLGIAFAF